ncbi:hypothetical protein F3Y22_tig00110569pilonHSYRG00363 [Hibiscus syriacus]|uniref:Uncharacterized protein n=1 Tax=Hibiscus syriacus TaxID=106335 RepID=A0A6A3A6V7_HIBSY|nr:hypothetical protein F3Y22_tig00110569pilonHSYRG00363 [Hibiscus syriacus]
MATVMQKIKVIEDEMAKTQKNKATAHHLGLLKVKMLNLKSYGRTPYAYIKGRRCAGEGFDVTKSGDARVGLIGFPSVGKSTLLNKLTGTFSEYSPGVEPRRSPGEDMGVSQFNSHLYKARRDESRLRSCYPVIKEEDIIKVLNLAEYLSALVWGSSVKHKPQRVGKEEVTTVNEHVEHPFCNSYNPEEEKEEEKVPEEKKMPREYNWNMPELLQLPEEELAKKAVDVTQKVYRGHEIMTDMNARFKISISYSQAWRAKCYALELLRGSPEASFAQLPAYCHNLKLKNPGSVTHIKTDRDGRFELLFIAIGATVNSFVYYLHAPSYYSDGAHLKGRYLGVNLLAVAMDANNGILPIAYGVGKFETSDSWTWFMGHLRDCIGPISNLTIISDRANSIDNAVRRCFPDAFHGLCGVHLYRNLKSRSYRQTYAEIVYPIPHPSEWDIPDDLQTVLPPAMDRRLPGRPKSHDRIPSKGEERRDRHVVGGRK